MDVFAITDSIANVLLVINHTNVMLVLGAVGLVLFDRNMFARAIILLGFAFIFKGYLKDVWQMPLPLNGEEQGVVNWAFPSGHTVTMVAFFGWLACATKSTKVRFFLVNLLWFIALFTIYRGYHYAIDIIGGIFFGSAILLASYVLLRFRFLQNNLFAYALLFLVPAFCMAISSDGARIASDTWLGLGLMGGVAVGSFFHFEFVKARDPFSSLMIVIGNALFAILLLYAIKPLGGVISPLILKMITWFVIFFWVSSEALAATYYKGFSNYLQKKGI
ncbi:MAG: hypothetical protein COZ46_07435 [Verrucomicrobia bacterium CG_4_10_14_3_um_filter_43_23]|nr:MAG: hypothetical protein AUJ82_02295 [Verrucomicrobia bacterium CG1_02_43_26]PIP58847.1 MAG: hypothetical protein COX01_06660 [Verrucomicrobia bacterium CG22_combo_CG10-13_8_21_14_all_43_17]PIX57771.1 MAG: hypothetical protein COZ46_07435 [Verrucomicrobia bacterium CG_4_10_14_3_um_filter_43_23]PIY61063.1 MAG: hypothetical protein COY94_07170 [Verrucomicrobia bacterium CG_4_10_14_0_8_um_filter_43_34]PJA44239.1 MAG: hypothetical protein CO175_04045 [Verrucomicrobia bacterium CG_4_9_14_3_um_fi